MKDIVLLPTYKVELLLNDGDIKVIEFYSSDSREVIECRYQQDIGDAICIYKVDENGFKRKFTKEIVGVRVTNLTGG